MSKNRSSFLKRDREAKKREKRETKKQRREDRKREDQQAGEAQDWGAGSCPPEAFSTAQVLKGLVSRRPVLRQPLYGPSDTDGRPPMTNRSTTSLGAQENADGTATPQSS